MTATPSIGLLGDVMLGRGVAEELRTRAPEDVWAPELRDLLGSLDVVICNLECSISRRGERTTLIAGKPFFFRAPPAAVDSLRSIGVGAVTLANNHALDYGEPALADTLRSLRAAGIATTGAGLGPEAARQAATVRAGRLRISVVGATDHPDEYAAAPGRWGVAHADLRAGTPSWLVDEVVAERERADLVVASPHWGPNMATQPAPWQARVARDLQRAGAHLVAGHSAHVFHGVGWSESGPILFDLGDALDDYRVDPRLRNDLGVLAIWRPGAGDAELELTGLRLDYARTELATGSDAEWIEDRLTRACRALGTEVERTGEATMRVRPQ